jgi:hypothetical protein
MCCDGTLFGRADLSAVQVPPSAALGMTIIRSPQTPEDERTWFQLPCHLLEDRRCTIYDQWRPDICGDYLCGILKLYVGGTRSFEECIGILDDVRATAADEKAAVAAEAEGREPSPQEKMGLVAMDVYRRRYFDRQKMAKADDA